jgi:hypothetical protein
LTRIETPEQHRQKARDKALLLGREALSLLELSVDWAEGKDGPEAQAAIAAVENWNRICSLRATPTQSRVYDQESEG